MTESHASRALGGRAGRILSQLRLLTHRFNLLQFNAGPALQERPSICRTRTLGSANDASSVSSDKSTGNVLPGAATMKL